MSIQHAYTSSKIIETLENYSTSDNFAPKESFSENENSKDKFPISFDKDFWELIFNNPDDHWGKSFTFYNFVLSEWVARVPGIYYAKGSQALRKLAESKVELKIGDWTHFKPMGKTQRVLGGIGSISLPAEDGKYLVSISNQQNASTGIPVLIDEEIFDYHKLKEGTFIESLEGKWRRMNSTWSQRFESVRDIPRGYIEVAKPEDIKKGDTLIRPTVYHPFSIMEYEKNGALFFDYVYVTVNSTEKDFREKIRRFLGEYEYYNGRIGKYLIEPFIHNPLLDNVQFQSPADLRKSADAAGSFLDLMIDRIREVSFNDKTIDEIKIALDKKTSESQLIRIATQIGINQNHWLTNTTHSKNTAILLDRCLETKKIELLVDALILENDQIFIN